MLFDEDATADPKAAAGEASVQSKGDDKKFDTARMKWNFRLLGKKATAPAQNATGKFVQQELFIPPQMTMYDYFLKKVGSYHSCK